LGFTSHVNDFARRGGRRYSPPLFGSGVVAAPFAPREVRRASPLCLGPSGHIGDFSDRGEHHPLFSGTIAQNKAYRRLGREETRERRATDLPEPLVRMPPTGEDSRVGHSSNAIHGAAAPPILLDQEPRHGKRPPYPLPSPHRPSTKGNPTVREHPPRRGSGESPRQTCAVG